MPGMKGLARRMIDVVPATKRQRVKEHYVQPLLAVYGIDRPARRAIRRAVSQGRARLVEGGHEGAFLVGVLMVRDEQDVVGDCIAQVLGEGADAVLVFDHHSVDRTPDEVDRLTRAGHPVYRVPFEAEGYYQAALMTATARMLASAEVTWVVPVDADELWFGRAVPIRDILADASHSVVVADVFDHVPTLHDDCDEPSPFRRIEHRRTTPSLRPKVAFRPSTHVLVLQGNHDVVRRGSRSDGLEVRHFPVRSEEQILRKLRNGRQAMAEAHMPRIIKGWGDPRDPAEPAAERIWNDALGSQGLVRDPAQRHCRALADRP